MNKPTILLTGATGFLGSKLLESLLSFNYKVIILKRSKSDLWRIKHLIQDVKSYDVDIDFQEKAFTEQKIDCVIHTACNYGRNTSLIKEVIDSNLNFGLKILNSCIKYNVKSFLNSDTLLEKNLNTYTLSKKQFVEWLKIKTDKIQVINVRIELMYGSKDDVHKFVPWIISQLNQNVKKIELTSGIQKRDFIYVDDVVSAYITILNKLEDLHKYNEFDVGTGKLVSVRKFLELLKDLYISNYGETKTKFAFGELPYREKEIMTVKVNNQPLIDLGWSPNVDLQQGIRNILEEKN